MDWLAENWVWVLVGAAFIGMHLFGHGGHGGHRGHGGHGGGCSGAQKNDRDSPERRSDDTQVGHRH